MNILTWGGAVRCEGGESLPAYPRGSKSPDQVQNERLMATHEQFLYLVEWRKKHGTVYRRLSSLTGSYDSVTGRWALDYAPAPCRDDPEQALVYILIRRWGLGGRAGSPSHIANPIYLHSYKHIHTVATYVRITRPHARTHTYTYKNIVYVDINLNIKTKITWLKKIKHMRYS